MLYIDYRINVSVMKDEILGAVGRYAFQAEPFHCDNSYHLFLPHLCNQLLNAADLHSNERGYGVRVLNDLHKTWVLSRFNLEISHLPEVYEGFAIETWVDNVMRYFTSRNFRVIDINGNVCANAHSIWALIDTDTRQPVDILKINNGRIMNYVDRDKHVPIAPGGRLKFTTKGERLKSVVMNYSDIDMNGHVNSMKYMEHMLNLWPISWHNKHRVKRFEIAYVAESYEGDELNLYVGHEDELIDDIKITKLKSNDEQEVVRGRICFD